MNFKRFIAVFKARNIEFFRDKSSLGWNLFFPVLLLVGFSFIFSGDGRPAYKVGVLVESKQADDLKSQPAKPAFMTTRFIDFIAYEDETKATAKLSRHSIDLLVDFAQQRYWVNDESANSYLVNRFF